MDIFVVSLVYFMVCGKQSDVTALKVHIEYLDDGFTQKTRCIINEAVEHASNLLTLRSYLRTTVFHIPRERTACAFLYYDGPNAGRCGQISKGYTAAELCGEARIPASHLEGLQVFDYNGTKPLPVSLPEGRGFTNGTNFILYLTQRKSQLCLASLAHSRMCRMDAAVVGGVTSGRPVAGVVNTCWKEGEIGEADVILIRRVMYHELLHLLAMNYRSMREFVECEGKRSSRMCWKLKNVIRVTQDSKVVVWSRYFRKAIRPQVCEGAGHCHPYNDSCACSGACALQDSTAVENVTKSVDLYGGVILAESLTGVHWPEELFGNFTSIMVPRYMETGCIMLDFLTLALLKTSGWYLVNLHVLPCINCLLNNDSPPYSVCRNVLENKGNSTYQETLHVNGEEINNKEILSITKIKASLNTKLLSSSEDALGDKTHHSAVIFNNCTGVAQLTQDCNKNAVFPDLKSDASICLPSCVLLIMIQIAFFL